MINESIFLRNDKTFHGYGQAKFAYVGLALGTSQFPLSQLPYKMTLLSKVVKIDSKILR